MNHMTRSDDEIYRLSGVNLIYLDETTYGIIREIRAPQPDAIQPTPKPRGRTSRKTGKVTCRDSSRGRKTSNSNNSSKSSGSRTRRTHSLSESRCMNYGITPTSVNTRSVQSSRRKVDYVSLNDGYDEDSTPANKRRKESFRPRSAPSATRLSAHKRMNSPETVKTSELSAVPSTSDDTPLSGVLITTTSDETPLSGVPPNDNILPDLVVIAPRDPNVPTATNTFEDLEAASTLLSLGDTLEETLDDDDNDNALLMPIGGANNPEDVAPQPIHLDQVSVDNVIAGIVNAEQTDLDGKQISKTADEVPLNQPPDHVNVQPPTNEPDDDTPTVRKGSLKTKTYVLRKNQTPIDRSSAVSVTLPNRLSMS